MAPQPLDRPATQKALNMPLRSDINEVLTQLTRQRHPERADQFVE